MPVSLSFGGLALGQHTGFAAVTPEERGYTMQTAGRRYIPPLL